LTSQQARWTARNINIAYGLPVTVQDDVLFLYSRDGSKTADVFPDGSLIESTLGLEERLHHNHVNNLGTLSQEVHSLTLPFANGGYDNRSSFDALGLCMIPGQSD
jgi:hypothetical protein